MPQNCSTDVTLVIDYIDEILTTGTDDEIYALKKSFGLEGLEHNEYVQNCPSFSPGTEFSRRSTRDYVRDAKPLFS